MQRLVMIDHDDSFTDTIVSYFIQLHMTVEVVHYLDPLLDTIEALDPSGIILSPGPGHPLEAKPTLKLIQRYYKRYPMLGVCLGMQAMAVAFGGKVVRAFEIMHGKLSHIDHQQQGLFEDLPNPFLAARYHSLMVNESTLPPEWVIDAWTLSKCHERIPMSIRHVYYPLYGLQFHPEAVLSEHGFALLKKFCGDINKF